MAASGDRRGFDAARPLMWVLILAAIGALVTAVRFRMEYVSWDRLLRTDMASFAGDEATLPGGTPAESMTTSVRERMRTVAAQIEQLPEDVTSVEAPDSFVLARAERHGLELTNHQPVQNRQRRDKGVYVESTIQFDLEGFSRQMLVDFLYDVESQMPTWKVMEIQNFQPAVKGSYSTWKARITLASRKPL